MFTASYVANHGYDLQETVNANMYASSTSTKNYGGAYGGLPTAAPDARFVTVTQYYNNGISNYNSLTCNTGTCSATGYRPNSTTPGAMHLGTIAYENPFNLSNSYGSLGFDNRHQMAARHTVEPAVQGIEQGRERADRRLDAGFQGVRL